MTTRWVQGHAEDSSPLCGGNIALVKRPRRVILTPSMFRLDVMNMISGFTRLDGARFPDGTAG